MGGMELDASQATSKLILTTLAEMATFERELMLERRREGIRKALEAGKYRGALQPPGESLMPSDVYSAPKVVVQSGLRCSSEPDILEAAQSSSRYGVGTPR